MFHENVSKQCTSKLQFNMFHQNNPVEMMVQNVMVSPYL